MASFAYCPSTHPSVHVLSHFGIPLWRKGKALLTDPQNVEKCLLINPAQSVTEVGDPAEWVTVT